MDDWPAVYNLESIEQVKAVADELRQRVLEEIVDTPRTVTQLGDLLGIAPAKVHYHVRELERVGLLKRVETREKAGILEKYYRTVARRLSIPPDLLQRSSPDDMVGALQAMLSSTSDAFMRAMVRGMQHDPDTPPRTGLLRDHVYLTDEQVPELTAAVQAVLDRYSVPPPVGSARQYTAIMITYDTVLAMEDDRAGTGSASNTERMQESDVENAWSIGIIALSRRELEKALAEGRRLDISITGLLLVGDDVTADLAERAILRFVHRGALRGPAEVLEVLARKEAATREK